MSHHLPRTQAASAAQRLAAVALLLAGSITATTAAAQDPRPPAIQTTTPRELSLAEALELVAQRSENVTIAAAGVERARGQLRQTRSQLLPQLTASANYQRTLQSQFEAIANGSGDGGGGAPPPDSGDATGGIGDIARIFASENTVTLGLQLNQMLFDGGRVRAQVRAAEAGREAAVIGVSSATAQAQLEVTQAYYDALLADRLVAIAESSLVQTERALRQTRLARQVGTTAEFDLLRAQVTRDNQLPTVIAARTQRTASLLRLRQLLELPEQQPLRLTTGLEDGVAAAAAAALATRDADTLVTGRVDAPVDVERLLAQRTAGSLVSDALAAADTVALDRAPVRQAELALRAQEQQLRAQRAQRLPSIGLASTYQRFAYPTGGVPGLDDFYPNWTVGLGVQLPILTGGRVGGQIQEAEAGVTESRARLQQAVELARLDAQLIVSQLEEAAAAYAASAGTAEQAARAYTIAEVRFREGISTQVELDDSRLLLQQSLANRAQAARNLNVARARLALLPELPLGAAQGGQGGVGGGAGAGSGAGSGSTGAPAQRAAQQTMAPAGGAGGQFMQGGPPEA